MQAAIKVANEPPTDVKSLFRMAYANFDQATLDKSTKPVEHRPMLFALSFFHAIALGRRKFGKQGLSRPYAWNSGDLLVCGMILHNYLEANEDILERITGMLEEEDNGGSDLIRERISILQTWNRKAKRLLPWLARLTASKAPPE